MVETHPGFNPHRLVSLMDQAIARCDLRLNKVTVLTEAATGAYVVTPVLAAMAGAEKVFALTKGGSHGTEFAVMEQTNRLAEMAGVDRRIEFYSEKTPELVGHADLITNSGHVRPLDAAMIGWMKPTAVIGLMYEAWEFRPEDVDITACRWRGIRVVGVNERHPSVDVFSYLGIMAVKLLLDSGVAVYASKVLLLCDNPFRRFIELGLKQSGARVDTVENLAKAPAHQNYDAILVAMQPRPESVLSAQDAISVARNWPGAVVAQFWGDIERSAFSAHNVPMHPADEPRRGHMGILPSSIGPEPIIRLQAGGLKAAEVVWRKTHPSNDPVMEYVQMLK